MNNLANLISLRQEIREKECLVSEIMPSAISEALDSISDKNQVVYRNGGGKIVLTMRKRIETIQTSAELAKVYELITAAKEDQAFRNSERITAINKKIAEARLRIVELEKEREQILTNDRIVSLKTEFNQIEQESTWLDPCLSVYLF